MQSVLFSYTGGKRRKTLRSPKSAAPSINNLKRIALSGISLDVNKKKKNRNAFTTEATYIQHYRNECEERSRVT